MKVLAAVLVCLFILITSSEEIQHSAEHDRQKRLNLPDIDICDTDADCGNERCCIKYLGICAPKRGLEESCNFSQYHGCGCKSGLFCQVAKCLGSLKYYRCLPLLQ
ncbi:hypothetical protein pdam_00012728 [Pocillopora damicornis]|uniref:Prokineticin domain-containing protein n=1 Tax=Pocillopora damicornis TaxID=46731 RepID=A0A3M6TU03_POCDA|nr:hypothetical protein pdam_00012728 [Pocillopora damicornis]